MALNDWADGEAGGTPLSAERLNERDAAIVALQAALTALDAADITDATAVGRNVLKAADAAAARTAIGAGTSSLALGATASTALAGNTSIPAATAAGTRAQLDAGTDTTVRAFSAKDIAEYVAAQIAAIP